jgi:hypothetical protein
MVDKQHDPGQASAGARLTRDVSASPVDVRGAEVRIGTASWTDRTLTARGVFYPEGVSTPDARLRHYASRFRWWRPTSDSMRSRIGDDRAGSSARPMTSCSTSRRTR